MEVLRFSWKINSNVKLKFFRNINIFFSEIDFMLSLPIGLKRFFGRKKYKYKGAKNKNKQKYLGNIRPQKRNGRGIIQNKIGCIG